MIYPGGCQRGRRTSPGLGSRRLSPQFLSPRFHTFCLLCFIGGVFLDNHVHCAGHLWAFHDPGHPLPVQSGIFGRLWRRHTTLKSSMDQLKGCLPQVPKKHNRNVVNFLFIANAFRWMLKIRKKQPSGRKCNFPLQCQCIDWSQRE